MGGKFKLFEAEKSQCSDSSHKSQPVSDTGLSMTYSGGSDITVFSPQ